MKYLTLPLLSLVFCSTLMAQDSLTTKLEAYCRASEATGRLHGYVIVKKQGNTLLSAPYGYSRYETKEKATAATKFQIGSVTKQFTAAVVLKLVEEGKLSLSDRLDRYYPGMPGADRITIEHLLTHTSGLYSYTNSRPLFDSLRQVSSNEHHMTRLFASFPLQFAPGTRWDYSNTAYSLLGYIIEKASGKPWEQNIRHYIFGPLGMTSAGFDFKKTAAPKATGYYLIDEKQTIPAVTIDSSVSFAAGAIYASPNDLILWDESLLTNRILSAAQKLQAFTPRLNKYGLGWFIDTLHHRPVLHHGGDIDGFSVQNIVNLQDSTIVLVMVNAEMEHPDKIAQDLLGIVYGQPVAIAKQYKSIELSAEEMKPFTGSFLVNNEMKVTLKLEDNKLMIAPEGQPFAQLYPESHRVFFFKIMDATIEFIPSAEGKVDRFLFKQGDMKMEGKRVE
jgi:CubicO group peptidase (beta-lactamase class C family)